MVMTFSPLSRDHIPSVLPCSAYIFMCREHRVGRDLLHPYLLGNQTLLEPGAILVGAQSSPFSGNAARRGAAGLLVAAARASQQNEVTEQSCFAH
jgi:hypothetical protein